MIVHKTDKNEVPMKMYYILISLFLLSCKTGKNINTEKEALSIREQSLAFMSQSFTEDVIAFAEIDSLLSVILESPFEGHVYTSTNSAYNNLRHHYCCNIRYENYIFQKVYSPERHLKGEAKKWANAIILLPKKDCSDSDLENRLNRVLQIVKDTSDMAMSVNNISEIAPILKEPCSKTLNYIQSQTQWRSEMFSALLLQLEFFDNSKEMFVKEYYEDVYEIMDVLPDSLTSKFAYDYLMNHDELPEYLEELIDHRLKDWEPSWSYSNYSGSPIIYSETQVLRMIERTQEIQNKGNCDWCELFIFRLNLRFED